MSYEEDRLALVDNEAQRHDEVDQQRRPMSSFDIESSVTSRQHHRRVVRPSRGLQIAKPTPFDPTTDPFAFVCDTLRRPKFGHQYVLFPERNGKRGDRGVGPSVGPHWAGVVYTISIIGVITLFLAKVLIGPDVAPWCQPVIVICSAVTVVLLLATAVADPGIVVESAESGGSGSCGYCEECSIWTPEGAEHCEECGVCIFGLDHHCPWMGKWTSAMGSATGKLWGGKGNKIEFMESTKMPTAKDIDTRRRNSLMFFMRDWQELSTFEAQEASMLQIKKYHQMEAKVTQDDPILAKLNKVPIQISLGDMRLLRETVIMKWKDINRSYQGPLLGDTVLHRVCREGYLGALKFMLDPNSKSIFETETVDPNIVNKRKRTAMMLCFTSPHFTEIAKDFGLERDPETGLAIPRAKRPETAQTDQDWMKPGTRVDREEMVRILVEDLKANVKVLDMHEYSLLHYASISGWERTVDLLLDHGADPRQTCMTGETALHFAVSLRHGKAAETLLKRSQDLVNEADKDGDRAIHLAVQNGDQELVNLLVDYQADINSPNYRRVTPLAAACKRQDWRMVNHLLDKKVTHEEEAFLLLEGQAEEKIRWRLKREEEERLKLARAIGDREADAARLKALKAYGQWVPYADKMGKGIFYYNKVSRESRRQAPEDYVKDKEYIMKSATFGMHFYH